MRASPEAPGRQFWSKLDCQRLRRSRRQGVQNAGFQGFPRLRYRRVLDVPDGMRCPPPPPPLLLHSLPHP
eukprot:3378267-Pyramimonas_sp.AAC.1